MFGQNLLVVLPLKPYRAAGTFTRGITNTSWECKSRYVPNTRCCHFLPEGHRPAMEAVDKAQTDLGLGRVAVRMT